MKASVKAPITETLAAALIMINSRVEKRPIRVGRPILRKCGTFPIEAAMMAANIAPGMNQSTFTAEEWTKCDTEEVMV